MATTKVSALSALTAPDGAEELLINDGGTSKKITITNVSKLNLKGGDLTSASPLVIDTDGNYFDVTGTTNFAAMTVAANRQFTLQFDGVLTMTHHATNIDLPGEANITTAAGDVATFQSTGANTVQCLSYTKADGTAIVAGSTSTATASATGVIKLEDDTEQSVAAESVSTTANRTYGLQLNSSDQAVVNVPWTDTNTVNMGSGFTVSATTDSNATTITQGDDLFFAAGTGITCTTSADGTVTIANTVTDTNTMGSGFTVSATTDSNATTITQGDDLMFTAGTGITCETTADGTVTIANTVTDTNTMGSGFTVSATTDTNATTITQGDDLMFTAGTAITCETTADGTVTIASTALPLAGGTMTGALLTGTQNFGGDANDYCKFTDNAQLDVYVNGNNEFRFEADGDFHADGDVIAYSTTTASALALKENVNIIDNALEKIQKLRGITFNYKRDGRVSAGVIAEDVQGVLPEAVKNIKPHIGAKDKSLGVNYGALTSILIEAIKELTAKVEKLENK